MALTPHLQSIGVPCTHHLKSTLTPSPFHYAFMVFLNLFHLNLIRHNFINYKILQHWCHSYPIGIIHLGSIIYTSHKLYFNGSIVILTWIHFGIYISHGSHKNIPNYYTTFEPYMVPLITSHILSIGVLLYTPFKFHCYYTCSTFFTIYSFTHIPPN